jgi:hypothetical protein
MKDGEGVLRPKRFDDASSDEAVAANEEDAHAALCRMTENGHSARRPGG